MERQRIVLALEYDGVRFHGWQRQDNADTVQQELESALTRIEGQAVEAVAAGRTDSGVHAEAMLVHADVSLTRWQRSPRAYVHGVNQLLPEGVVVTGVKAVAPDFHARFDCLERRYRYQIWNRSTPSAIQRWRHWWMPRPLDIEAMRRAATLIIGQKDFSAFRAAGCQAASAVRHVRSIEIERCGCEVHITAEADAFLYHMVRNIVGNLVQVGTGKWEPEHIAFLLECKDRTKAAATAPAHGLYFIDALYPEFRAADVQAAG
jgi:tRNA pseudouridine38-40 synthase